MADQQARLAHRTMDEAKAKAWARRMGRPYTEKDRIRAKAILTANNPIQAVARLLMLAGRSHSETSGPGPFDAHGKHGTGHWHYRALLPNGYSSVNYWCCDGHSVNGSLTIWRSRHNEHHLLSKIVATNRLNERLLDYANKVAASVGLPDETLSAYPET